MISTIWELPFGRGRSFLSNLPSVAEHVLGGWQFFWVGTMQSGQYFSPSFSGSDPSNTNTVGGLPDRIGNGNLPAGERTIDRWFDASAFAVPAPGRFGNSGANVLEGPGLHMHNLSISKTFSLTEQVKFTFTAASQNALNHPNFGMPSANISVPGSVGVISSTRGLGGAREMMLRGRLAF